MDQISIKAQNPKCRLFFKIDLERDFAASVQQILKTEDTFTHVGIFDPTCELMPL
jgi:hypothetical protein